jgi:hypothetical protein
MRLSPARLLRVWISGSGGRGSGLAAQRDVDGPHADFAARRREKHCLGALQAELRGQLIKIRLGLAAALQLARHDGAPLGQHLGLILRREPLLDLAARTRGGEEALRRIQPVARRARRS